MVNREELLKKLEKESLKPENPLFISSDEYKAIYEISQFRCPMELKIFCGGKHCPPKPDDPNEDYYEECKKANRAKQAMIDIQNGKIFVFNGVGGWRMPG